MERATRGVPESPARRAARVARVGARYGFGFVFGSRLVPLRRRAETGQVGIRLRRALEELGPTFTELGRFLSARGDLLPPNIAAELGRVSAPPKPMRSVEVRSLLERELGNTLGRLFLEFDEAPVRVGVFTQSHRAVLPGGRPALVVVNRQGIRRDLLAMRPVADLTRRRLGDRLPLDPTEIAVEFAAHAAHRRDMHLAAQNARRLREIEDTGLRIPDVYRSYSTGRCITFESPGNVSTGIPRYQEVSDALVRLALVEGIFLSDITPERFTVSDGEVWLADPTEALAFDDERLRGVAEVLAATRREDVDGVVRTLRLVGSSLPDDTSTLRRELRETLGSLGGPLWQEHSLSKIRSRGLEAMRKGEAKLQGEIALLFHSLVALENLGRGGDERYVGTIAAAEAAGVAISRHRDPRRVTARAAQKLGQFDTYADFPRQVHALLDELKDGEIEVRFRHEGLDDLISKVDILANRLVFAFLIAALIIGSSMLGIFSEGGVRLLGVSVFGLIGFVFAAILGLALLVGIIRSGRL